MLNNICNEFEERKSDVDFFSAISKVLTSWGMVKKFSLLELSESGKKLRSPRFYGVKYQEIPSLWLGKVSDGIDFISQNTASQVVLDLMGGDIASIFIRGDKEFPEKILYIKFKEKHLFNHFNWTSFERYLSGLHTFFCLRNGRNQEKRDDLMTSWDFMNFIDDYLFDRGKLIEVKKESRGKQFALIDVDLSELVKVIRKHSSIRFYWSQFYNEFTSGLKRKINVTLSPLGINRMGILVDNEGLDSSFEVIKYFCHNFSYWKYFEELDFVLTENMQPKVKMIPISSQSYLEDLMGRETQQVQAEKKGVIENVWRKSPNNPM